MNKIIRPRSLSICLLLILFSCVLALYLQKYKPVIQVASQLEFAFNITLESSPSLLQHQDYGWAEESGFFTLVKLDKIDCRKLVKLFTQTAHHYLSTEERAWFEGHNIRSTPLLQHSISTGSGDFLRFILHPVDCALLTQQHFE